MESRAIQTGTTTTTAHRQMRARLYPYIIVFYFKESGFVFAYRVQRNRLKPIHSHSDCMSLCSHAVKGHHVEFSWAFI